MVLYRSQLAVLGLALALTGTLACGDDGKDDGNGGDGSDGSGGDETFNGVVVESTNPDVAVADAKAYLFNTETGEIDRSSEQISNSNGEITFQGRSENTGVFVEGDGVLTQDTWNFPPSRTGEEDWVRVGSTAAAAAVPGLAGYDADPDSSPLAGSVLWLNPDSKRHEYVGCATIEESDGVADVRFFDMNLPTNLATRSLEEGTKPYNGSDNDAEAGKYFIGNVKGGTRTITAKIGDEVIGSATVFITPRSEGGVLQDSGERSNLTLANIIVDESFTSNPTPADCQ